MAKSEPHGSFFFIFPVTPGWFVVSKELATPERRANMEAGIEVLVGKAREGDKYALEDLVRRIQDRIYGLALRMLYDPSDAEDAAQEILVKIVTNLGGFKGASAFTTWMFRIAANHLLNTRRRGAERSALSFEECERAIDGESADGWRESESEAQQGLIVEELKISCLQGMLLCLDRGHRLAYALVDIFDADSAEGAEILDIRPATFRKRLSRARARIRDFMFKNCTLVNPSNPCRCSRQAVRRIESGDPRANHMIFARHPCRIRHDGATRSRLRELDELNRVKALFKLYPDFAAPGVFVEHIRRLVASRQYELL